MALADHAESDPDLTVGPITCRPLGASKLLKGSPNAPNPSSVTSTRSDRQNMYKLQARASCPCFQAAIADVSAWSAQDNLNYV